MIRHIDAELQGLKDLALQMGDSVEKALDQACKSVLAQNKEKCSVEVREHESRINDLQMLIDESCVNVLAKQAPVAKDLRLVIAITKINTDLERMGDQSVNIVRNACDLYSAWPQATLPSQLTEMIDAVRLMVRSALDAFSRRDVELSNKVLAQDDQVDDLRDALFSEMKEKMKAGSDQVEIGLAFIMIGKNLERMADHATNIAEEVIYLATGNDVRHGHNVSVNS
ncbi:MAG: phosphate signaling complex protein PhoU [Bdellovibrionales bacterium]|nr:phosphate signaling complex protein PhoU [Bdellovibrionales bacterium]